MYYCTSHVADLDRSMSTNLPRAAVISIEDTLQVACAVGCNNPTVVDSKMKCKWNEYG